MLIFAQSAKSLKGYVSQCIDKEHIQLMAMRMVLAFILHRGRMSCSAAAAAFAPIRSIAVRSRVVWLGLLAKD